MTVQAHFFREGRLVIQAMIESVPRVGDTVRYSEEVFCTVTEVVWCLDENTCRHERVNIRTIDEVKLT